MSRVGDVIKYHHDLEIDLIRPEFSLGVITRVDDDRFFVIWTYCWTPGDETPDDILAVRLPIRDEGTSELRAIFDSYDLLENGGPIEIIKE